MAITILDPTVPVTVERTCLADRLDTLDGTTVGLFSNRKLNADRLLCLVGERLQREHGVKALVRGRYEVSRGMRRDEWIGIERCDAVVLANGD
jgi:hypothetical protein